MKLRARVRFGKVSRQWYVDLWQHDERSRQFFGSKHFDDYALALQWALWRVGVSGYRG